MSFWSRIIGGWFEPDLDRTCSRLSRLILGNDTYSLERLVSDSNTQLDAIRNTFPNIQAEVENLKRIKVEDERKEEIIKNINLNLQRIETILFGRGRKEEQTTRNMIKDIIENKLKPNLNELENA